MDRQIVYPGAIPLETDILNTNRNTLVALGMALQAILGTTTQIAGLACQPASPASMRVTIGPGSIYSQQEVDPTAYSSLPAITNETIVKQGLLMNAVTLTLTAPVASGQSVNYLVEASFAEEDAAPVVLPFYNADDPTVGWSGPNNTGEALNTVRMGVCNITLKAGLAAATGSQVTPTPDAGAVGLYVITVANGQSTITSSSISLYPNAPFISEVLPQKISQTAADARYGQLGAPNTWSGQQTFNNVIFAEASIAIDGPPTSTKPISYTNNEVMRFQALVGTEANGANYAIVRYDNSGNLIDTPFSINRSTGVISTSAGVTFGNSSFQATISGSNPTYALAPNVYLSWNAASGQLSLNAAPGQYVYLDTAGVFHASGGFAGNVTGNVSGSSGSCTGNSATATTATTAGSCSGNSATASKWATGRNVALTGAVTGSATVDGSADVSITTSIPAQSVTDGQLHTMGPFTVKGNGTGSAATPGDITMAGLLGMLGGAAPSTSGTETDFVLPGGGIIKVGTVAGSFTQNSSASVTFANPFPNSCAGAFGVINAASVSSSAPYTVVTSTYSASGASFNVQGYQSSPGGTVPTILWVAFGH